jgi:hypothetical protein
MCIPFRVTTSHFSFHFGLVVIQQSITTRTCSLLYITMLGHENAAATKCSLPHAPIVHPNGQISSFFINETFFKFKPSLEAEPIAPTTRHTRAMKHRDEHRRIALPPIPEEISDTAQGCTARDAPTLERTESTLSSADTPVSGRDWTRDEDRKRAARPSYREARGRLTLKASADHPGAVRAVCSIEHRVLTLSKASRDTCGDGSQHISPVVLAQVPLEELAVRLQRGRADMFTIATRHKNRLYDEIYCFADDQAERDEWIAVFRQMGVSILHLRDSSGAGARDAPARRTMSCG